MQDLTEQLTVALRLLTQQRLDIVEALTMLNALPHRDQRGPTFASPSETG